MKRFLSGALLLAACLYLTVAIAGVERQGPTPQRDPNSTSSVAVTCSDTIVQDCGFENGPTGGVWTDASSNFGSPICSVGSCGLGASTNGSHDGTYWAWFGGISGVVEEGSETQNVTLPTNSTAQLTFWLLMPACSGDPNDFIEVTVDGNQVWRTDATDAACGTPDPYAQISVDVSAYADGGSHVLQFHSITQGSSTTNFFVDDVDITTASTILPFIAVPALGRLGLLGLLLFLVLVAGWRLQRTRKAD